MKEASRTKKAASSDEAGPGRKFTIMPGVGLVDLEDPTLTRQLAERLAGRVGEELMLFASRMREGLLAASVAIGLEVMGEFFEAEVTEVAGPKGKHNTTDRQAYRHGTEDGSVVLGGRKLSVRRPRVRSIEEAELRLEPYDTFASVDLLTAHTVAAMLAGCPPAATPSHWSRSAPTWRRTPAR
jgi:hypothetical protein